MAGLSAPPPVARCWVGLGVIEFRPSSKTAWCYRPDRRALHEGTSAFPTPSRLTRPLVRVDVAGALRPDRPSFGRENLGRPPHQSLSRCPRRCVWPPIFG